MRRLLVITLSIIIGLTLSVNANEKEDSLDYYFQQITSAKQIGNIDAEKDGYKNFLRVYKELAGDVSQDTIYANIESAYGLLCAQVGDYENAIMLITDVSEIYKNVLGSEHPFYIISSMILASYNTIIGNYSEAIKWHTLELDSRSRLLGENILENAETYHLLAFCYSQNQDYEKAIEFELKAINILSSISGENNVNCADYLTSLTQYYLFSRNYKDALSSATKASKIYKDLIGTSQLQYAESLVLLAGCHHEAGNYSEAIKIGTQAKELLEDFGDSESLLNALTVLSSSLEVSGDYIQAVKIGTEALETSHKLYGNYHENYASKLSMLSRFYGELGNYDEAIKLETQAKDIRKVLLGEFSMDYSHSLRNLAVYNANIGNYVDAVMLASRGAEIYRNIMGEMNEFYAISLGNLAGYYADLGDISKAISLETQVLDIYRKLLGENNIRYGTAMANLATYYDHLGNDSIALILISQALDISKRILGKNHPDYAVGLNNLATFYFNIGEFSLAIQNEEKALAITESALGKKHPDYARFLKNLASFYFAAGLFTQAERLYLLALERFESIFGIQHPLYIYCLIQLAFAKCETNDTSSTELLIKGINLKRQNTLSVFRDLTINERQMYWNSGDYRLFNHDLPIFLTHQEDNPAPILYDNMALFAKGLLLSSELEMNNLIHESGDTEALQMYSELQHIKQTLSIQYSKPIAERQIDCDSLERASTDLEHQLVARVKEFCDYTHNLSIKWQDVQGKLSDDDIAIEFLSYIEGDGNINYIALTLCKNDMAPLMTSLFRESALIEASGNDGAYQTLTADSLIWRPLSSRLEGKLHVYFSASGLLHNIGIEYLPSMEGKECYRLSSTRELVTHKPNETLRSATLYGDIDYDATYASIEAAKPSNEYYAKTTEPGQYRGNFDYRSMRYGVTPLPGTRAELKEVTALLTPAGVPCDALTGTQASEESFKALSGQRKSLLHISTHGFYYNAEDASNQSDHIRMMLMGDSRPSHAEDQSLLRCGLCFAGANQTLSGESQPAAGQGDGILNALEIAQTDLRGLDLVVLSACQTALGDITQGEGVFGLQRGFKKAGAQSILMSLWNVDDEVTQLLMTEFYRGWTSGMTKTAALRKAQAIIKQKYPDPRHWAAFILLDALD